MKQSVLFILIIIFLFAGCNYENNSTGPEFTEGEYFYNVPEQTNDDWETASLSSVGINQVKINQLMKDLQNNEHLIHSIVIAKQGKLVFEEYFSGKDIELDDQIAGSGELKFTHRVFDRSTEHFIGSAYKSFISALIGIAIDKNLIQGVDDKMFSYFPDYLELSNAEKNSITIGQMLNMTSGLPWDDGSYPIYDPRNDEYQLLFNEDQVRFVLEKPMSHSAGVNFHYNSGTTFLLGEIVKRASGINLNEFAEQYLFGPLNISNYRWAKSRNNTNTIFMGGLYLRSRDMAKFGQLILNGGLWNNKRIISEDWVNRFSKASIHFSSPHPPMPETINGYSFQWWLGKSSTGLEVYCAAGWGGNFIIIIPEVNITIVFTAGDYVKNDFQKQFNIVNNYILPALN